MQKTKLGISVGLVGALTYFGGLFGGYLVALILFGYILLVEDNPWLRKTAVKSVVLLVAFSALSTIVGLIPELISFINSVVYIFDGHFSIEILTKIINVITSAISIIKTIVFIVLGIKAFSQGTLNIPVVDNVTNKNM